MARHKQFRFQQNTEAENVIERGKSWYTTIKNNWSSFFKNQNPLILELACGKGEYTVALGEKFPDLNFIGIDIKGDRIARGSQNAISKGLKNIAFLRTGIQYLDEFFNAGDIQEIWLIHPDPQPRDKEEKRRLTNSVFLNKYKYYLKEEGIFYLKTDSSFLYEYTLDIIKEDSDWKIIEFTTDLIKSPLSETYYDIETHYGQLFEKKGHTLHFIKAQKCEK